MNSISRCKYSPNPWSINASHPKKAGKSGDSNLMLHGFREYLHRVRRKPFVRNELRLSYLFHTAPAATLARMRKRGVRQWFHNRTECC